MSEHWPVYRLATIDSTNSEAKRRVSVAFEDQWIVADQQTAGRGRQDRSWVSPAGNVYATAVFHEPGGLEIALRVPFAAALAVSDVVKHFATDAAVELKWPNDVRIGGQKVSGILVETGGGGEGFWIAAGIGLNVLSAPVNLTQPVTSLSELGMASGTSAEGVFTALRTAFSCWLKQARSDFGVIRQTWLARAEGLGQPVHIHASGAEIEGIFDDLDADGALVLRLPDGSRRSIRAGEIGIRRS